MDYVLLAFYAVLQGVTEFLPISSSGHLLLAHHLFHDTGDTILAVDIAVHCGSLITVLIYFRHDVMRLFKGAFSVLGLTRKQPHAMANRRLLAMVIIASLPVIMAGFVLFFIPSDIWRTPKLIAWTTLLFGILLWIADKKGPMVKTMDDLRLRDALVIGLFQVLALIPGTSRSGITMTAGRFLGMTRYEAARFALLLSVVAIAGAGTMQSIALVIEHEVTLGMDLLIGVGLSALAAWVAIALMMRWLKSASFTPFVIYRVLLGLFLLYCVYAPSIGLQTPIEFR